MATDDKKEPPNAEPREHITKRIARAALSAIGIGQPEAATPKADEPKVVEAEQGSTKPETEMVQGLDNPSAKPESRHRCR